MEGGEGGGGIPGRGEAPRGALMCTSVSSGWPASGIERLVSRSSGRIGVVPASLGLLPSAALTGVPLPLGSAAELPVSPVLEGVTPPSPLDALAPEAAASVGPFPPAGRSRALLACSPVLDTCTSPVLDADHSQRSPT